MKVLLAVSDINSKSDGIDRSTRLLRRYLTEAGHEVRVLALPAGKPANTIRPDYITKAVEWADIIHLAEPFALQRRTARIARSMGKPCVGSFQLFPKNVFLRNVLQTSHLLLLIWKKTVFDLCSDVQCPSQKSVDYLRRFNIKARLHLIPEGRTECDVKYSIRNLVNMYETSVQNNIN